MRVVSVRTCIRPGSQAGGRECVQRLQKGKGMSLSPACPSRYTPVRPLPLTPLMDCVAGNGRVEARRMAVLAAYQVGRLPFTGTVY